MSTCLPDAPAAPLRSSPRTHQPCGRATRASVATACAGVALSCRFRAGVAFSCRLSGGLSFAEIEKALCEDFPSMPAYAREHLPVAFKQYAEGETLSLPGFMKMHAGAACRRDATRVRRNVHARSRDCQPLRRRGPPRAQCGCEQRRRARVRDRSGSEEPSLPGECFEPVVDDAILRNATP